MIMKMIIIMIMIKWNEDVDDNKNEIIMTMKLELMTLQGASNGILFLPV